jgi:hypothetical protein
MLGEIDDDERYINDKKSSDEKMYQVFWYRSFRTEVRSAAATTDCNSLLADWKAVPSCDHRGLLFLATETYIV